RCPRRHRRPPLRPSRDRRSGTRSSASARLRAGGDRGATAQPRELSFFAVVRGRGGRGRGTRGGGVVAVRRDRVPAAGSVAAPAARFAAPAGGAVLPAFGRAGPFSRASPCSQRYSGEPVPWAIQRART